LSPNKLCQSEGRKAPTKRLIAPSWRIFFTWLQKTLNTGLGSRVHSRFPLAKKRGC